MLSKCTVHNSSKLRERQHCRLITEQFRPQIGNLMESKTKYLESGYKMKKTKEKAIRKAENKIQSEGTQNRNKLTFLKTQELHADIQINRPTKCINLSDLLLVV
jgi:hypothetical protein